MLAAAAAATPTPIPTPIPHEREVALDALAKCAVAFAAVRSYRTRVAGSFGTILGQYRAPDRFRFANPTASTVLVGDRAFSVVDGRWSPVEPSEALFLRDLVKTPAIMYKWARLTRPVFVREFKSAVGPVRIFRYISYDKNAELFTTIWISRNDNLPRYAVFDTLDAHTTVEYLDFNAKVTFDLPPGI